MKHESQLRKHDTVLIIIDIQEKLLPAMCDEQKVSSGTKKLAAAAGILGLPVIISEQYPKGLGHTFADITASCSEKDIIEKTSFSCARSETFLSKLKEKGRHQILICGIETHVCVLQTALDLTILGYQVHIAEDAVSSRTPENSLNALERMRRNGIIITNIESALFEMLDDAENENFRAIAKLIK